MSDRAVSQASDRSNEREEWHYWTRLPNIVLRKVDDPFEGWLLFAIRKVVGDMGKPGEVRKDKVCYMSCRSLAELASMGKSTVHRKIRSLAKKGLIEAKLDNAPKGRKVWHIRLLRSVWEENEKVYEELSQRGTKTTSEGSTVPEGDMIVPEGDMIVPEITATKNRTTKNRTSKKIETSSEKKASLSEKDEHGKYIDRSALKRCKECGQFQRECYCENGPFI